MKYMYYMHYVLSEASIDFNSIHINKSFSIYLLNFVRFKLNISPTPSKALFARGVLCRTQHIFLYRYIYDNI